MARTSLTRARHLRALRDRGLLALAAGLFLGADWGAAIAAIIDSRGNTLSRPLELVTVAAFSVLGGAAGHWFARHRA